MNTKEWDWEKTMKDIGVISKIHPEIVDEYILLTKEAVSSRTQGIREKVSRIERDLMARMAHEDYEECETCEETLHHVRHVLQILESNE